MRKQTREMVVGQKTCEIRNILRYYINKRCVWKKKPTAKKTNFSVYFTFLDFNILLTSIMNDYKLRLFLKINVYRDQDR